MAADRRGWSLVSSRARGDGQAHQARSVLGRWSACFCVPAGVSAGGRKNGNYIVK